MNTFADDADNIALDHYFCLKKDSSTLPCSMVICQQYFCFTVAVYILFIHRLSSSCAEMISG